MAANTVAAIIRAARDLLRRRHRHGCSLAELQRLSARERADLGLRYDDIWRELNRRSTRPR